MRNVNYKSDFDFIMRLKDCADDTKTVPFPDCDFDAMFWTSSKTKAYIASCKGGVCTNCFRTKDGDMHFVFDNQHMGLGTLHWEPHFELPNDLYPDSIQDLFRKAALDIKLVDGDGDCPTTAEVELIAPFIKGDKGDSFTYDDFTTEDKAELIAPIKDNIDRAITQKQDKLTTSVDLNISEDKVLSLTERAKQRLFDDLWLKAVGTYGSIDRTHAEDGVSKPYYLNELWLTYEEATAVYEAGAIDTPYCVMNYYDKRIRTNLPIKCASFAYGTSTNLKFRVADVITNSDIEVMNVSTRRYDFCIQPEPGDSVAMKSFKGKNLRKIMGIIDCGKYTGQNGHRLIDECPVLESVSLRLINTDINLSGCPKINADSIRYMVNKRMPLNPKDVMITLHPDVYAKVTSAVDDPEDEWYGLIDLAAAKQITFACA